MTDLDVQPIIDDMLAHPEPDSMGVDAITRAIRKMNDRWPYDTPGLAAAYQKAITAWNTRERSQIDAEAGDQPGNAMQRFAGMITTSDRAAGIGGDPSAVDWGAHRMKLGT